jgi:hypothetical protein
MGPEKWKRPRQRNYLASSTLGPLPFATIQIPQAITFPDESSLLHYFGNRSIHFLNPNRNVRKFLSSETNHKPTSETIRYAGGSANIFHLQLEFTFRERKIR